MTETTFSDLVLTAPGCEALPPGEWVAIHVFYMAKARPMVRLCIKPLIEDLVGRGLLANYFFIHYWVEGPHLRLPLRPSSAAATEEVKTRTEAAINDFLRVRPALYDLNEEFFVDLYNKLFQLEFAPEEQVKYLNDSGRMRQRPNNSFSYEDYEPELGKYGGPAGIELAEWHFRHSADLVMQAVTSMNLHLRTVALGFSAQLMMVMSTAFIQDQEQTAAYLFRYHEFWSGAFADTDLIAADDYEKTYQKMSPEVLARRFLDIRQAFADDRIDELPRFTRFWFDHCIELRRRVVELVERRELSFPNWVDGALEVATEVKPALDRLLSPYMHMTNNRLEVSLADEAYLSYVLSRTLRDAVPADATPAS